MAQDDSSGQDDGDKVGPSKRLRSEDSKPDVTESTQGARVPTGVLGNHPLLHSLSGSPEPELCSAKVSAVCLFIMVW